MTRFFASFVVAILLALSGLPITANALAPSAHACCRTHGAHHCEETDSDDSGRSLGAVCPYHSGAMLFVSLVFAVQAPHRFTRRSSQALTTPHTRSTSHQTLLPTHGRAPPALI